MEIQTLNTPVTGLAVPDTRATWERRLAQVVSAVASPPVVGVTAVLLITLTAANPPIWSLATLYLLLTVALPLAFIGWLRRRGRVSDLDLSVRQERILPLFVTLAAMVAGWLILHWAVAPRLLLAFAAFNAAQVALFLLISLFWKISMHTTAVAALAVIVGFVLGDAALLLFPIVPLVGWSRLRLRRHTLGQAVAGALLGILMCLTIIQTYGA